MSRPNRRFLYTYMWFATKTLNTQIQEYLAWKETYGVTDHAFFLEEFSAWFVKDSLVELTFEDLEQYHTKIQAIMSRYVKNKHLTAIRCLLKYHKARGLQCLPISCITAIQYNRPWTDSRIKIKHKQGRPPLLGFAEEVQTMRRKRHLSFRKITEELEHKYNRKFHLSQIHDWAHYPIDAYLAAQ